ncbi:hypothetical protein DPQ25_04270 [Hydrogeniiclostridium mannosilyticum]|uniref:Uncharacterized protein n=1 Tax=Hydrogeniiclostridium mannosilyticum TaxID=2764322 RepID=A0A328UL94_9FIRM|nr:hypothetical protein DPQ25_04270 [Hydrogeniiclostridium mannosilyticum]
MRRLTRKKGRLAAKNSGCRRADRPGKKFYWIGGNNLIKQALMASASEGYDLSGKTFIYK